MGGEALIKRRARRRDPQCLSQAWCGRCGSGGWRAKRAARAAAAAGRRRRRRGPQSASSTAGSGRRVRSSTLSAFSHSHPPSPIALHRSCGRPPILASQGRKRVEVSYCLILWKGYPPELATWELESLFDAYEAELDAAAPELGARRRRRRTSGGRAEE
mmetsp:Transcript_1960/g.6239  ORF Transcript_1960/g.6239 Transcript_1960/m.6239 type:complete len:159 (+) Transcript_1960:1036-1512(+)